MPEESRLIGYTDEVSAFVVGHTVKRTQSTTGMWVDDDFNLAVRKPNLEQKENPGYPSHISQRFDNRVKTNG